MVCIYCASPTDVVNSRQQKRGNTVWRRRRCSQCTNVFTTTEAPDLSATFRVPSKANSAKLLPFSRDKLFMSLYESCKHRPAALSDASSLTTTIISGLLKDQPQAGLLHRKHIAQTAHHLLSRFDKTAASVYLAYHPQATS
jgi:transcriptional regulator NrdR family protein